LFYLMFSENVTANIFKEMNLNFGFAPTVAVIAFCVARYDNSFSRMIESRAFVSLGDASYSIYLLHILVFFAALGQGQELPPNQNDVAFIILRLVFALALICVLSLGLYQYVEAPSRRWLRSLWGERPQSRLVGIAAVATVVPLLLLANQSSILAYDPYAVSSNIKVLSATYGENCGAPLGNATAIVRKACNGRAACDYPINHGVLGDAAPGCGKSFSVEYACLPSTESLRAEIVGSTTFDASGSISSLRCAAP
jgi:hypothetical protein